MTTVVRHDVLIDIILAYHAGTVLIEAFCHSDKLMHILFLLLLFEERHKATPTGFAIRLLLQSENKIEILLSKRDIAIADIKI